ncbi:DUF3302 domain-containing protein [Marinobacter sp. 1-3A]|uniref:DUF3302 domain-containing protein n=1 Tax=unclassified Marinobacter TaxID=83889 RepID=UPI001906DD69|nr:MULTISPECIES: DUF3302 domain-containing protein [unclassified Marinobacter]MBK1873553.1 DUF3302 domain-containing protein [Marinobacter sp. 1-3A]MBK1885227.1 DUF3302 domain-containing protein [Marinobacter sp. DY40_1A1]
MLDYIALGILIFAAITVFYGIIVIHDIPYDIAEKRRHPHADAIHVAGWISLLTLHIIWPFLWIWATLYREDRGWGFNKHAGVVQPEPETDKDSTTDASIAEIKAQMSKLSVQVAQLQQTVNQLAGDEG